MKTYLIDTVEGTKVIVCLKCGRTSYHPVDIREKYCGHCSIFHDEKRWDDQETHVNASIVLEELEKIKKLLKEI